MKGLQVGMPYYRMSTSNTEAIGTMVIQINEWLKSLPEYEIKEEAIAQKVTSLLKKATNSDERLSDLFAEILGLAKSNNFHELISFCNHELKGFTQTDVEINTEWFKYRMQTVIFSIGEFKPNPLYGGTITSNAIIELLKEEKNYYEYRMLFAQPITEIESFVARTLSNKSYSQLKKTIKDVMPNWDGKNAEITMYMFHETYVNLYKKIRQKAIELLMAV